MSLNKIPTLMATI